jgi:hypothetical protein
MLFFNGCHRKARVALRSQADKLSCVRVLQLGDDLVEAVYLTARQVFQPIVLVCRQAARRDAWGLQPGAMSGILYPGW